MITAMLTFVARFASRRFAKNCDNDALSYVRYLSELFDMADRISLARRHFQTGSFPHFDVSAGYRDRALKIGADPVDRYGLVAVMKRYRACLASDPEELVRLRDLLERYGR